MSFHKISGDSQNAITNALDFFTVPATDTSHASSEYLEILPLNSLSETPYHFKVHSSSNYVDLSKSYLLVELRIRKADNLGQVSNLAVNENVAMANLCATSWIKDIKFSINNKLAWDSNSLFAYKAWMDTELTFNANSKDSWLTSAGYYGDTGTAQTSGVGYDWRKLAFRESRVAQFITRLDIDFANQPLYLINFTELDIEIIPADSRFSIIAPAAGANANYKLEVTGLRLYVKSLQLMDGLALDIARHLDRTPAKYALKKTMIKSFFIGQSRYQYDANLFQDLLPKRIVCGLVKNADFVGSYNTSPFNFQHFNVRSVAVTANGRNVPNAPYELDYANDRFSRAFYDLNDGMGFAGSMESNGISMSKFKSGWCLYCFDLSCSGEAAASSGMFDLIRNGTTSVSIRFAEPVEQGGLVLVVLAEVDQLIMIDKNRSVAADTAV